MGIWDGSAARIFFLSILTCSSDFSFKTRASCAFLVYQSFECSILFFVLGV